MKKSELKALVNECMEELNLEYGRPIDIEELKQWSNSYRYKDVVRALKKLGWVFQRQEGSHATFYNPNAKEPPYKKSITIVDKKGTGELDRGAIVAIQKETGLDPTRI